MFVSSKSYFFHFHFYCSVQDLNLNPYAVSAYGGYFGGMSISNIHLVSYLTSFYASSNFSTKFALLSVYPYVLCRLGMEGESPSFKPHPSGVLMPTGLRINIGAKDRFRGECYDCRAKANHQKAVI